VDGGVAELEHLSDLAQGYLCASVLAVGFIRVVI
jgi:hypothetical protein